MTKTGEQRQNRTAKSIDGLPVVAHSHNLGIAQLGQFTDEIVALAGYVLILIDDDIFKVQPFFCYLLLAQQLGRLVYHIFKIDALLFAQRLLVFHVADAAYIQKQACPDVLYLRTELVKLLTLVALRLEVADEMTHQQREFRYIFALFRIDQFLIDSLHRPRFQNIPPLQQLFLQMFQKRTPVIIHRKSVHQVRLMFTVQLYLVIHPRFISIQFFLGVTAVLPILRNAEMLYVGHLLPLLDSEIRRVRLVGVQDTILVDRFIFVFDVVQIKEIGYPYLLDGAQHFIVQRLHLARLAVYNLLDVFLDIAPERGKVRLGDELEVTVHIVSFIGRRKIRAEKQDQLFHQHRIAKHFRLEIVFDNVIHEASIHDFRPTGITFPQDGITRRMKGRNRTAEAKPVIDTFTKFPHSFVGK